MSDLYEALADTAKGDWGREAAVDLIHRHGRWLPTLDEHGWTDEGGCDDDCDTDCDTEHAAYAVVRWEAVAECLTTNDTKHIRNTLWEDVTALRVGTGSERRILLLACSLAAGTPVSIREAFYSLDHRNTDLALHAIAHAARGRAYAEQTVPLGRPADPHKCDDCGTKGVVKPWHPHGDLSKVMVVCFGCGNAWIIPAEEEQR